MHDETNLKDFHSCFKNRSHSIKVTTILHVHVQYVCLALYAAIIKGVIPLSSLALTRVDELVDSKNFKQLIFYKEIQS